MGICQIFWILTIWSIPRHSLAGGAVTGCCHGKYWQRQYLKKTIFGAEHLQASPLLALLIGRYSPHCRHKPLSPNILGNIFLDKLGQWQMWRVDSLWTGGRENYSGMKKKGGRRRDFTISYDLLRTFQQSATMCGGGPWCSRLFRDSLQKILSANCNVFWQWWVAGKPILHHCQVRKGYLQLVWSDLGTKHNVPLSCLGWAVNQELSLIGSRHQLY